LALNAESALWLLAQWLAGAAADKGTEVVSVVWGKRFSSFVETFPGTSFFHGDEEAFQLRAPRARRGGMVGSIMPQPLLPPLAAAATRRSRWLKPFMFYRNPEKPFF
jgi:hypothetical protein